MDRIMEKKMKSYDVFKEFQKCQNDIPIFQVGIFFIIWMKYKCFTIVWLLVSFFQKLIASAPLYDSAQVNTIEWQMVLAHIIEIVNNNTELGNERVLLACHAFYAVLPTQYDLKFFKDVVIGFQKLTSQKFSFFERNYTISDMELFKLVHVYGYLQMNRKDVLETHDQYIVFLELFNVIYRNCMKYTRYSYFAYKILSTWLKRLKDMSNVRFWNDRNCILERKLEAIIFSNWSNALTNLCKQNAEIFNVYLQIMSQKYHETFVDHVYRMCLKDMSWQNETKYVILAEIIQVYDMKVQGFIEKGFLFDLCISLTKNSLRCGGTKLYLAILKRLNEIDWRKMFGKVMRFVIGRWESGDQ